MSDELQEELTDLVAEDAPELDAPVEQPDLSPGDEGVESPPPVTGEGPPAEPEEADYLELDDVTRITREQAAQLAQLHRALETDPRQVAAVFAQQFLADQYDLVPRQAQQQPQAPSLDDDVLFDPNKLQQWLAYQIQQGVQAQIAPLRQEITQRQIAESHSYTKVAADQFAAQHGLSKAQLDMVAAEAARTGILQATAPNTDPIKAVHQALERTYWSLPAFRDHEEKFRAEQAKATAKRQRKLSMVGGTSGSVPRTQPRPQTPQARLEAMAADISAHLGMTPEEQ